MSQEIDIEQIKNEQDIFRKAKILKDLVKHQGVRIIDLAKALSMKPSYVCHILRLNRLPEMIIDGYYSKMITVSHLFVLSRLKKKEQMVELYEKLLTDPMTVLQMETIVREMLYDTKTTGSYIAKPEINEYIEKIEKKNKHISIQIIQTRIKCKCIVEIKGSLDMTTPMLRKLIKLMESWEIETEVKSDL